MIRQLDSQKLAALKTADEHLATRYGAEGTAHRAEFEARARAWYFAEILRERRKAARMTQQQLAEMVGKKREYIAMLERGETDMQLSTFIMISDALGLKFALTL
ncbi:MAG: helix-turn-helix domain-containing protein [Alistipes sp.]|jgi:DNA-binding XRE family transcriptional regulator|nr:helix-turn-helix domain-containing protein [Alistipes sp.]